MNDEKRHELLHEHRPENVAIRLEQGSKKQYISDAVLGGIDGCVTTFAVVSGAVGAGFSSTVALVLGFANLIADGFSMAVSNYESISASREYTDNIRKIEELHIEEVPEGEREEIRQIFQLKGFKGETLNKIVDTISKDKRLWVDTMLTEEYGLQLTSSNPYKSAFSTFFAFLLVGTMPLLPLFFPGLVLHQQYLLSAIVAGLMFFSIGMLKSLAFRKPVFLSGLRTLLTGGTAAGLAFLTGYLLREAFGISGV